MGFDRASFNDVASVSFFKRARIRTARIAALAVFLGLAPSAAEAWGRRGHQIVADVAAVLVAESDPKFAFVRDRSYDLGYYSNVPDLVWKKPSTYQVEWTNHFMDLEIFRREVDGRRLGKGERDPYELTRSEFDARFPDVKQEAGRSFWRIRELDERLGGVAAKLAALPSDAARESRHALQLEWFVVAGALGHYVGDMSQPLHASENYDGQLSGQKGVHSFYEDDLVDVLYPALAAETLKRAQASRKSAWEKFRGKSPLQVARDLAESSMDALPALLKLDKRAGRGDVAKAASAHRPGLSERLAAGALALGEIWRRHLGWKYDGEKFYAFDGSPAYIAPGPSAGPAQKP